MKKSDIVGHIARDTSMPKADIEAVIECFFSTLIDGIKKEDKITLVGYFTIEKKFKPAHQAHNPRTKAKINVPAKTVVKIKAGKNFLEAVQKK